ncbi:MAG: tail fiber domain-containing protein [Lentimicrobium sp.]
MKILFLFFVLALCISVQAQVAINTDGSAPDNSAMLDVKSDSKGVLVPRVTLAQRDAITTPATGLMIFQTDNSPGFYFNSGTSGSPIWKQVGGLSLPYSGESNLAGYGFSVTNSQEHAILGQATNNAGFVYGVTGISYSQTGRGVYGRSATYTGAASGVHGVTWSSEGNGVMGYASSATGVNHGVYGLSHSSDGMGVFGESDAVSGTNYGVYGRSISPDGYGVYGEGYYGIKGVSSASTGTGVFGEATSTIGFVSGVYGKSAATQGHGVFGYASSATGSNSGVYGFTASTTTGRAIFGEVSASTGESRGVEGKVTSADGYSGYFLGGRFYVDGNVGIGTPDPECALDVRAPDLQSRPMVLCKNGDGNVRVQIRQTSNGAGAIYVYDAENTTTIFLYGEGSSYINGGNLGIGTTSPACKLQVGVAGDGTQARANAWNLLSDVRLKKELTAIVNPLDKVMKINGYYYFWNTGSDQSRQVGFSAQEVWDILPEAVSRGEDGYLSIEYGKMTPLLLEAIKELKAENDRLKADNQGMNLRLQNIEAMMSLITSK